MAEIDEEVKAHYEALRKHYDKVCPVFIRSEAELRAASDGGGKDAKRERAKRADKANQNS